MKKFYSENKNQFYHNFMQLNPPQNIKKNNKFKNYKNNNNNSNNNHLQ